MQSMISRLSILLACVCLSACQKAGFAALNAVTPADGAERIASELFAPEQGLLLDVFRDAKVSAEARPVVVFFYGGSWQSGRREWYRFVGQALARAGYVAVIPDYRTYPRVKFPTFMDDAATAVAYAQKRAASWGGDPQQVYLMGHSAGAHIAVLLGLDQRYLKAAGSSADSLRGVIGLSGPYDFLPLTDDKLKALFGEGEMLKRSQPINFVRTGAPTLLLIHGQDDSIALPRNSERLAAQQIALGSAVTLELIEDQGHFGPLLDLRKKDSRVLAELAIWRAQ